MGDDVEQRLPVLLAQLDADVGALTEIVKLDAYMLSYVMVYNFGLVVPQHLIDWLDACLGLDLPNNLPGIPVSP